MATHSSILAWRIPWTVALATVHRVTKSQVRLKQLSMHTCIAYLYDLRLGETVNKSKYREKNDALFHQKFKLLNERDTKIKEKQNTGRKYLQQT